MTPRQEAQEPPEQPDEAQAPTEGAEAGSAPQDAPGDPEEFKPGAHELVVSDLHDRSEVFVVLDRHDERQILEEFQRRALAVMLYDFPLDGKRTVDLSYQGVNEAIRLMNATGKCRIRVRPDSLTVETEVQDRGDGSEEFYVATVYAEDEATGYGQYGTSSEPKLMRLRNGKTKWDVFARTKAINKAQRNALKTMIPEPMRQTMIAQYKGDAAAIRQIQVGAGAGEQAELPPPLTDEKAEAQKAEARAVYLEIREADPLKVKPAQFHSFLARAEHSHDRLDDFIAYLKERRDEVLTVDGSTS